MKNRKSNSTSCIPDCEIHMCGEAIAGRGEDSYCFCYGDKAALLAVFDGCGGAGARRHPYYSDMSEAYMASRLCAGAVVDTFQDLFPTTQDSGKAAEYFTHQCEANCEKILSAYKPPQDAANYAIKGSMVRTLPSTIAATLVEDLADGGKKVTALWLGDSRCYLLTKDGLVQLTVDDTSVYDPMENLYKDGVLRKMLCADSPIQLHSVAVEVKEPFVVFSATDGCFGYFSTPMEFEGVILETLMSARNTAEWEDQLSQRLGRTAGDDYTLCLAAYGIPTFPALQNFFSDRYTHLKKEYLSRLKSLPIDDRVTRQKMWDEYKSGYLRYYGGAH